MTYQDFIGTLEIIKPRIFSVDTAILVFKNNSDEIKVIYGKAGSKLLKVGSTYTIGHIGKKLINIRPGFCSTENKTL